jgi:hypothetical protein
MSRIYVDRISPYQSGSVQVDGLSFDTGSLVTTASFNTYTASQADVVATLATTGSNTFVGNQVVTGTDKQTYSVPGNNQQIDNITVSGVTIGGTPYNVATVGYQNYGGAFENVFSIDQADSVNFNYYASMFTNGKGWTYNLVPSGSGGTVSSIRLRETDNAETRLTGFANEVELSAVTSDLFLKSLSGSVQITGSVDIETTLNVNGAATFNNDIKQDIGPNNVARQFQNPNYFSQYYGSFLAWRPENNGGETFFAMNEKAKAEIQINAWSSSYDNVIIPYADVSGSYIADWDGGYNVTPWITIERQQTPVFNRGLSVAGALSVSELVKIDPSDPLPSGELGMLAVSGSNLYFHDGNDWVQK